MHQRSHMCLSLLLFDVGCGLEASFNQGNVSHAADPGLYQKQRTHGWNGRNTFWSLLIPDGWEGRWTLRGIYVILFWCEILGVVASVNLCIAPKQKWLCRWLKPSRAEGYCRVGCNVSGNLERSVGHASLTIYPAAAVSMAHTWILTILHQISCFTCMKRV